MEHFRDAIDCFQQAEKLVDASAAGHMARCRMAHAEWYFRLGSQYQQEGNNAEAINCYEMGLALNPAAMQSFGATRARLCCVETRAGACRLF